MGVLIGLRVEREKTQNEAAHCERLNFGSQYLTEHQLTNNSCHPYEIEKGGELIVVPPSMRNQLN